MELLNEILLIDDSNSSNQYNKVVLEEMNISKKITIKNSAQSALDYLKGKDTNNILPIPKLILLDLIMPQMDGFNFMDKYIELDAEMTNGFQTVVCVLSDYLDAENFEETKKYKTYGLVEHIRKPIDKEDIENLIEEHLDD